MIGIRDFLRNLRLVRDPSGIAAVEFALLLPVLLTLFLGSYELSSLLLAYLKLESAAESAADLVAQTAVSTVLQSSDFTNITNAVDQIMVPFPTTGTSMKVAYASVTYNTGSPVINWHTEVNGATAITVNSLPKGAAATNMGTNSTTDSVIVALVTYSYASPITYALASTYALSEAAYMRPRYVSCVPTYLNTNNVCP
jgi:Flp pilus assembly protein TadG